MQDTFPQSFCLSKRTRLELKNRSKWPRYLAMIWKRRLPNGVHSLSPLWSTLGGCFRQGRHIRRLFELPEYPHFLVIRIGVGVAYSNNLGVKFGSGVEMTTLGVFVELGMGVESIIFGVGEGLENVILSVGVGVGVGATP